MRLVPVRHNGLSKKDVIVLSEYIGTTNYNIHDLFKDDLFLLKESGVQHDIKNFVGGLYNLYALKTKHNNRVNNNPDQAYENLKSFAKYKEKLKSNIDHSKEIDLKAFSDILKRIENKKFSVSDLFNNTNLIKQIQTPDPDPDQERDTSPPVDMPKGDATPLQSKETIQSLFSAVALSDTAAIGKMLKAARNEARMTQAAVADAMETHDSAIRRIEAGKHKSNMDTLEKYAGALGLEIELTLVPTKR